MEEHNGFDYTAFRQQAIERMKAGDKELTALAAQRQGWLAGPAATGFDECGPAANSNCHQNEERLPLGKRPAESALSDSPANQPDLDRFFAKLGAYGAAVVDFIRGTGS